MNPHKRKSERRMGSRTAILTGLLIIAATVVSACAEIAPAAEPVAEIVPVEEQQIINVVEDYYVRDAQVVPEYIAEVEQVENNWARVSIRPRGVETENGPTLIFLQNHAETQRELPAPTVTITAPHTAPVSTDTGWVIVAGPQATFTEIELNAAGVPAFIRP